LPNSTVADAGRALCQRVTICNKKGLHASASARFVRTAECYDAEVSVVKDGISVDAS